MLCCVILVLVICRCFSFIISTSCVNLVSNNVSIKVMMIITDPISSQLRVQEANESSNVKILSLINVTARHDDFPLGRISNRPIK